MRKAWALAVAVTLVAGALLTPVSGTRAAPSALVFSDHFTSLTWANAGRTSAEVDTSGTGIVRLPRKTTAVSVSVSLRPGRTSLVVKGQDQVMGYSFDGTAMRTDPGLTFDFPSVVSVAFSSDGGLLFAASGSEVRTHAFDPSGRAVELPSARISGLSGVLAVEAGPGQDVWVLTQGAAMLYSWDGSGYRQRTTIALSQGKSFSFNESRDSLVVVDGDTVRYFAFNGSAYVEVPDLGATIPGASSVAQIRGGGGYRVQTGNSTVYVGLTGNGVVQYAGLADVPGGDVAAIAESPWGDFDYVAVTATGIQYRSFDSSEYRTNTALSVTGAMAGTSPGYSDSAVFVSAVIPATIPVGKVRIVANQSLPGGTAAVYEVSTDGGSTWTPVVPNVNTLVPPGSELVYRITLSTSDRLVTPVVDEVTVLQIVTQTLTARAAWGRAVHVRLIK